MELREKQRGCLIGHFRPVARDAEKVTVFSNAALTGLAFRSMVPPSR